MTSKEPILANTFPRFLLDAAADLQHLAEACPEYERWRVYPMPSDSEKDWIEFIAHAATCPYHSALHSLVEARFELLHFLLEGDEEDTGGDLESGLADPVCAMPFIDLTDNAVSHDEESATDEASAPLPHTAEAFFEAVLLPRRRKVSSEDVFKLLRGRIKLDKDKMFYPMTYEPENAVLFQHSEIWCGSMIARRAANFKRMKPTCRFNRKGGIVHMSGGASSYMSSFGIIQCDLEHRGLPGTDPHSSFAQDADIESAKGDVGVTTKRSTLI